jgi:sugar phosphate isomerase/epimerase
MKPSVTITLVPSLSKGPWIYWESLELSIPKAKVAGFDAVELFPASAESIDAKALADLLRKHAMRISAVGSGAGKALRGLHLVNPDAAERAKACEYIAHLIDLGAQFGAPVIIGSMQGSIAGDVSRAQALGWIREALNELAPRAKAGGVELLFEPLNRYETNVINCLADGVALIRSLATDNVALLADLFHLNIEESSVPAAIRESKGYIGYVHLADSNRRPAGLGHIDFGEIIAALRDIGYDGYVSAEALPYPDPDRAAAQTMTACRGLGIA